MYCPKCGTRIHEASQFCVSCGARLSDLGVSGGTASAAPAIVSDAPISVEVNLYAGFWRRLAAYFIDYLVLVVFMVFMGVLIGMAGVGDDSGTGLIYLASIAGAWLYGALMESSVKQATLGKLALGIKVTDLRGEPIGFGRATGRHFAKILSGLTLCIGFAMAGFTRRRQGLHDMVAGTLVVRREVSEYQLAVHPEAPTVSSWAIALLVVFAAAIPGTGILAAIAIPAYQDYTIRSQVTDGLLVASEYKAAVAEAVASNRAWGDISSESLALAMEVPAKYLSSIEVIDGVVVLEYGGQANDKISGARLLLVPGLSPNGDVLWVCGYAAAPEGVEMAIKDYAQYTGVEQKYLPSTCRK